MKLLERLRHTDAVREYPATESYPDTVFLNVTTNRGVRRIEAEKSAFDCPCGTKGSLYRLDNLGYELCLSCFEYTKLNATSYSLESIEWLDPPTPE
jgi:hypothetical protein